MIRQPTPLSISLAWHSAAVGGMDVARSDGMPECGWFKWQAVKSGPWLPVRIWLHQSLDMETGELTEPEAFKAACLGQPFDAERHWLFLRPIRRDEYDSLCRLHGELDAMSSGAAIDLSKTPIRPARSLA
jgi:hypothetical protein